MGILARLSVIFFFLGTTAGSDPIVTFCDLVRSPQEFNGKEVTVRATYRYGFEWQEFYCLDCLDKGKAWLEIPFDIDDTSEKGLKRLPKGAGIVNLSVQGTFMGPGSYGHLGGYRYKLVAKKISRIAIVLKGMRTLEEEKAAEAKWACGGTNPE